MLRRPIPILLVLLAAFAACTASGRQKSIAATYAAVHAADDTFAQYDKDHRTAILAGSASHEQKQASLNEWDGTVDTVEAGIQSAYAAISAAAALNDAPSLAGMLQAWTILQRQLAALGVL